MFRVRYPSMIIVATVLAVVFPLNAQAAPLTNGDFSAGFDSWSGEVTDIFFTTTPVDPLPGAFADNFDSSSGEAVLTTTTLADDIFSVLLVQEFDIGTVTAGNSLILSYDVNFSLTDELAGDTALMLLSHGAGFVTIIDLLGTTSIDVTFLAGQTVELLFGIEDFDDLADTMTVDNVIITETTAQVPTPGSLSLLGLGMMGFAAMRRKAG